jgi:hypothetical protein
MYIAEVSNRFLNLEFAVMFIRETELLVVRGSAVVDGDAFGKIEGILEDDRGWRARHGLQMVSTNYISGPGDDNRRCRCQS